MCGRARCTLRPEDIPAACGLHGPFKTVDTDRFHPSYNVSPGSYMPVIRCNHEEKTNDPVVHCMKWGLVPSFTQKSERPDFFRMFNARSESVQDKASFRRLLPNSRCLAVVEGFYEWKKDGAKKQPYYIHFKDDRPLVFAALFDCWTSKEGEMLYTFTILTTRTSKALEWLHNRMPVILRSQKDMSSWLGVEFASLSLKDLTQPYEAQDLVWYPVTPAMGKSSFEGPECIKEIKTEAEIKKPVSRFFGKQSQPKERVKDESEIPQGSLMDENELKALVAAIEPDHDASVGKASPHNDFEEEHGKSYIEEESKGFKSPEMKNGKGLKRKPPSDSHSVKKSEILGDKKEQRTLLNFFGKH